MEAQTRKVFPGGGLPRHTGETAPLPGAGSGSGCLLGASANRPCLWAFTFVGSDEDPESGVSFCNKIALESRVFSHKGHALKGSHCQR